MSKHILDKFRIDDTVYIWLYDDTDDSVTSKEIKITSAVDNVAVAAVLKP